MIPKSWRGIAYVMSSCKSYTIDDKLSSGTQFNYTAKIVLDTFLLHIFPMTLIEPVDKK